MIERFSEALRLLISNIWLLSAIILTVWLPANIVINYVSYNTSTKDPMDLLTITLLLQTIFAPISIGAVVHALYRIKSGHQVTYKEAMSVALSKWSIMLFARLYAGILIGLGLIALVIPGIVLAVRYSLLEETIIIEDKRMSESLARSKELTSGRRWEIFWSVILFAVFYVLLSFLIYMPFALMQSLWHVEFINTLPFGVVFDCFNEIAFSVLQIVFFLFFWEARQQGAAAQSSTVDHMHA
jgi:hypothetical protein